MRYNNFTFSFYCCQPIRSPLHSIFESGKLTTPIPDTATHLVLLLDIGGDLFQTRKPRTEVFVETRDVSGACEVELPKVGLRRSISDACSARQAKSELIPCYSSCCCCYCCCSSSWGDVLQLDRDEIWQDYSCSKYASVDVRLSSRDVRPSNLQPAEFRRSRLTSFRQLAVYATVPNPYHIRTCYFSKLPKLVERQCRSSERISCLIHLIFYAHYLY